MIWSAPAMESMFATSFAEIGALLYCKNEREKLLNEKYDKNIIVLLHYFIFRADGIRLGNVNTMYASRHAAHHNAWFTGVIPSSART